MKLETVIRDKIKAEDSKNESAPALLAKLKHEKERLIKGKLILNSKGINFKDTDEAPFDIPKNWIWVMLNEVSIIQEGPGIRKYQYKKEGIQFLTVTNILEGSVDLEKSKKYVAVKEFNEKYKHYKLNKNDIVTACSGASWGKSAIYGHPDTLMLNTSTLRLRFFGDFGNNKYLYYLTKANFFKKQIEDQLSGQQPNFGYAHYSKIKIPLPPLKEQKRIVSIIDTAFASITKAKTNAEQNLKNAKELFESYIQGVFENKGEGWEEQLLENCFKLSSGDNLTAKNMTEGIYPVFGGNGIAGYHNDYNLSFSNVIIGRVGALCGNVRHITENIWLTDNAFKVVDFKFEFDHSFLTFLLNYKDLRNFARQAAQPVISNSSLKDVVLEFPKSLKEQKTIVQKFDALSTEIQKLEAIYQQKINDFKELKKSILQKAFAGELK
jgi:type I restriction enzyme S subunit